MYITKEMEETDEEFAKCGISMEEQEHGEEEALTRDECRPSSNTCCRERAGK